MCARPHAEPLEGGRVPAPGAGLGLVHNNGRHVLVVRTGAGLVLLLAAAQGLRVLLLPAAGQTAQRR